MKNTFLFLLALMVSEITNSQTWVNSNSDQLVSKIQLLPHDNSFNNPNTINPTLGYIMITFTDGTKKTAEYYLTTAIFAPTFFLSLHDYNYYAIYDVRRSANMQAEITDGLAFKIIGTELCVWHFRYLLQSRTTEHYKLSCFQADKKIPSISTKDELGYLQKLTKSQLIEIIQNKKPTFPIAPVCLSCPPKDYEKIRKAILLDDTVKIVNSTIKNYK